jgi:rRNA maturation protein Nop10
LNGEKIWQNGRNPSWIMIRFGKYRRKLWNDMKNMEETQCWIVKRFGKYRRTLWNDMENMEEK